LSVREYLPHGVIGILMVAIFSAAMSSLSSTINSLSAATVEDLFNRKKQLNQEDYIKFSKYAALFWGVVCIILAFFTGDIAATVIEAINKIGSVFYGPIFATFIAAIGLKRTNFIGANAGLLAGVLVNVYLWLFCPQVFVSVLVSYIIKTDHKEVTLVDTKAKVDTQKAVILILFAIVIIVFSYFLPKLF